MAEPAGVCSRLRQEADAGDLHAILELGETLRELGWDGEAETLYRRAIQGDPARAALKIGRT